MLSWGRVVFSMAIVEGVWCFLGRVSVAGAIVTVAAVAKPVLAVVRPGSIVILHDGGATAAASRSRKLSASADAN
jgi:hypothetical protein